jgi:hypothetical protein
MTVFVPCGLCFGSGWQTVQQATEKEKKMYGDDCHAGSVHPCRCVHGELKHDIVAGCDNTFSGGFRSPVVRLQKML